MRVILVCLFLFVQLFCYAQLTADFSASPLTICIGDSIEFTDLSVEDGSPIQTWNWDFGDGSSSNLENPWHTFTSTGPFNITLTVQAVDGSSDAEVKAAYILVSELPVANITLNGLACVVPFDATFTNLSETGADITYAWDFGNGQQSTDFAPTGITYSTEGTFTVELIVTNTATGCSNEIQIDIDVYDFVAGMNVSDTICLTQTGQFYDASSAGANSWLWDFGDGPLTSNQPNTVHTYLNPGNYTVTLTAENTIIGCISTVSQNLTVVDGPTANFTIDDTLGCSPMDVTFTDNSSGATQFVWYFGDGTSYSGPIPPVHTYTDTGWYGISLVVSNDFGCSAAYYFPDSIRVEHIDVGFILDPMEGCDPLSVNFTDTTHVPEPAQDPIVDWNWTFDNGNTYNGQFPPTQIYNIGVYSPSLTITTASGCVADTVYLDSLAVGSIDTVAFSYFPLDVCANTPVNFIDETVIGTSYDPWEVQYLWSFGDGGSSTLTNPTYNYAIDTGFFDVQLIVTFRGCSDSASVIDAVHINAPVSNFNVSDILTCNPSSLPVQIDVDDVSIIGELSDDAEMIWSWGDGTFTYFDDPDIDDADQGSTQHDYSDYGSYQIEQVIHNYTTGCSDTSTQVINISYLDAGVFLLNDTICLGDSIVFQDASISNFQVMMDTVMNTYNLGGVLFNGPAHTHTFSSWGTYQMTHSVMNLVGCTDIDTLDIVVLDIPSAGIIADINSGCAPLLVNFDNISTPNNNGVPIVDYEWTFADTSILNTGNIAQNTSFVFNDEGTFYTVLNVQDAFGCTATAIAITDITKPTADFLLDSVVCDLENFTANNQSMGEGPLEYDWFVDGIFQDSIENYSGAFDEINSTANTSVDHTITLIVTDINGCTDTLNTAIVVSMPNASANFAFSGASINEFGEFTCPPVFATLQDTSQSYGQVVAWDWTFGNGNSSTLQNPQNTYVFSGTYTSTLSIVDEYGCTDDTTFTDYLVIMGPSANPSWVNIGDLCDPQLAFYADDQENVYTIDWDLGDGQIVSDTSSFVHIYDTSGTYIPSALISDNNGCQVPYQLPPIDIFYNTLDALFAVSMMEGEVSEYFYFDDQSTYNPSPIVEWSWDFSTDVISNNTDEDVSFAWDIPGEHTVTLTVADSNGCIDTYSLVVLITTNFNIPNVFSPNNDGVNDFFQLDFDVFDGYDYAILNRWGNVMVEGEDFSGPIMWDGNNGNGNPCVEGVYFYTIVGYYHDGTTTTKHGHITLVR
ncbi:MAG: PKD domain-containing protein [Crocinitomicaceae bacterium]|nr:PKD domain-containing protein [Crocinitomicaceae bacterium]